MPSRTSTSTSQAIVVLCLLLPAATRAQPVGVRQHIPPNPSHFSNPHIDCLAITVLDFGDRGMAQVRIEEVLRGARREGVFTAVFAEDAAQHGPAVGEAVLVFAGVDEREKRLYQGGPIYKLSKENRDHALEIMAPPDRTGPLQLGAFLTILAAPFIGRALLFRSRSDALSSRRRRLAAHLNRALALFSLGVYGFYESGVCGYCDIRVDLLLIFPALSASVLFALSPVRSSGRELV